MAMMNVVTLAAYRRIYWLKLIGLVQRSAVTWRSCYIQSNEPSELSQWQCHDDSTINIGISIIIVVIITIIHAVIIIIAVSYLHIVVLHCFMISSICTVLFSGTLNICQLFTWNIVCRYRSLGIWFLGWSL